MSVNVSESRVRDGDVWMAYIARAILGEQPESYPEISNDPANPEPYSPYEHLGYPLFGRPRVPTYEPNEVQNDLINKTIQQYLHTRTAKNHRDLKPLLKLCGPNDTPHSYDLAVFADRAMTKTTKAGGKRVADLVGDKMMEVLDALTQEELTGSTRTRNAIRRCRLSLRTVLVQFCRDTGYLPPSLFLKNINIPLDATPSTTGSWLVTKIYRIKSGQRLLVLKSYQYMYEDGIYVGVPKRLQIEAIPWLGLKHDNILPFLGFCTQESPLTPRRFLVSPWMANGDILSCMEALQLLKTPIPRTRWIYEVACGLRYLHGQRIVHGNLHTKNILVDEDYHVRIADYGFADILMQDLDPSLELIALVPPSSWWEPPELLDQGARPSYASDVWSFGCACLLIWTGKGPYHWCMHPIDMIKVLGASKILPEGSTPMDAYHHAEVEEAHTGTALREDVVLKCWLLEPKDRPPMATLPALVRAVMLPFDEEDVTDARIDFQ